MPLAVELVLHAIFGIAIAHGADTAAPAIQSFVYKKTPQADLELLVHYPPGWKQSDKRPAIVFFFGGGWQNGKITQFEPQATHLAGHGMVAARADYRVKSRHDVTPKECVEDAKSAVRWLRQNAATLGVDPDRIVAAGGSAGGHVAACTALAPGLDAEGEDASVSSKPNALVLFNPVLQFSGIAQLMERIDNDEALGKAISPTLHLASDSPPTLIFFGTGDRLAPMGDVFIKRSKELGHRAELYTADGQQHGFFNQKPWLEKTTQRMDEFLVTIGCLEKATTSFNTPGAGHSSAVFDITAKNPADHIKVNVEKGVAIIDVMSQSGIGSGAIGLASGTWPTTVVLRLHLRSLESVAVSSGRIKLSGSVLSHSGNTKRLSLIEEGREGEREPGTEIKVLDAAGKPIQGLPGKGGYFEITLPTVLLEGEPTSLELRWIDFYRG
jgi:acetyl esterase/lipase